MPDRARMTLTFAFALAFSAVCLGVPASTANAPERLVLVVLTSEDDAAFGRAVSGLRASGARPLHLFPPSAAIVLLPEAAQERTDAIPALGELFGGPIEEENVAGWSREARLAAAVWNSAFVQRAVRPERAGEAQISLDDALEVPSPGGAARSKTESGLGCPAGARALMVSEYMLGAISLNVVLPQSTGEIDPSTEYWDEQREGQVLAGIVSGTQWLIERGPQSPPSAALSFTYHLYSGRSDSRAAISYEPIGRAADPTHEPGTGEGLWTNEILDAFGYSGYANRWVKARAFDNDTRLADGTNWAATVFVADSLSDPDGRFSDNRFAYTWQPGSHIVMTYDNSGWGIGRMGSVFAHELCHAFWAKDEYSGSGCSCGQTSGYLDATNQNCAATCSDSFPTCVMRSADLSGDTGVLCPETAKQIGWADIDGDGLPDSVQALPILQLSGPTIEGTHVLITGTAQIQAAPNLNPSPQAYTCPITIAKISKVETRADGGPWIAVSPDDGGFGKPSCSFTFQATGLSEGPHSVDARASDTLGQTQEASQSFTVQGASAGPPPIPDGTAPGARPMLSSSGAAGSVSLLWDATCSMADVNLYYGFGSGLPRSEGESYTLAGSRCSLGNAGSASWSEPPDPSADSSHFLWWVLVATDDSQTEGSWGADSSGSERNGNQASGQCGFVVKNIANAGCVS